MIEVRHLTKKYGPNTAVDDISFTVEKGRIYGFLGPNGAGKSTTMNIICGCLAATDGEVIVDGHDIYEEPLEARKRIGYLPEIPPLYNDMTPKEYLSFVGRAKKIPSAKLSEAVGNVMTKTALHGVADRLIRNLSKGYRQRVGIAQAILGDPEIIILDEPTIGLDPKQIIEIRNLIRNLGRNHTVILSTHILSEVQAVCDRIVIINAGRIVADEKAENIARTVEEIRRYNFTVAGPQREVLRVLRGVPGVAQVEVFGARVDDAYTYTVTADHGLDVRKPVFRALADASYPIVGLEAVQAGLEEIFVRLTDRK